jgi:hypothetical protein
LYLAHDLKSLGITKPLPNVYERSAVSRAVEYFDKHNRRRGEAWDAERMGVKVLDVLNAAAAVLLPAAAITTYDGIITARAGGKGFDIHCAKTTITTVANEWSNLWRAGGFPTAGAFSALGAGTAPDRSTAGAWSTGLVNPTNPDKKYLLTLGLSSTGVISLLLLADLLSECGGILFTSNPANAVNSAALTRYTTGAGVLANFTVTTQLGATAGTIQLASYTDQDGNTGQANTAATCVNTGVVERLVGGVGGSTTLGGAPFTNLAAGDYGVRAVTTATVAGNTGGGIVGLSLYYPLCYMPGLYSNVYGERDSTVQIDGLTELMQASGVLGCLMGFVQPSSSSTGTLLAFLRTCDG